MFTLFIDIFYLDLLWFRNSNKYVRRDELLYEYQLPDSFTFFSLTKWIRISISIIDKVLNIVFLWVILAFHKER